MSTKELIARLKALSIHPKYYGVEGEIKDLAHNIERLANGRYLAYYLERGEKCGAKEFATTEEANSQMLKNIEFDLRHGMDLSC